MKYIIAQFKILLCLFFSSTLYATDSILYYYESDNKTADEVIKRLSHGGISLSDTFLAELTKRGKLRLIKKFTVANKEKTVNFGTPFKVGNDTILDEFKLTSSCNDSASYGQCFKIDMDIKIKVDTQRFRTRHFKSVGFIPRGRFTVVAANSDKHKTRFLVMKVPSSKRDEEMKKLVKKHKLSSNTLDVQYDLLLVNKDLLGKYLKEKDINPFLVGEIISKSKKYNSAKIVSYTDIHQSINKNSLTWLQDGKSSELGFNLTHKTSFDKETSKMNLVASLKLSNEKKFSSTADYSFEINSEIKTGRSLLFLPTSKSKNGLVLAVTITEVNGR